MAICQVQDRHMPRYVAMWLQLASEIESQQRMSLATCYRSE